MPYTRTFIIPAATGDTNLTLEAVLYNTSGLQQSIQTTLFWEYPNSAYYQWTGSIPDNFRGSVLWRVINSGRFINQSAINPEEIEYLNLPIAALNALSTGIKFSTDRLRFTATNEVISFVTGITVNASGLTFDQSNIIAIKEKTDQMNFENGYLKIDLKPLSEAEPLLVAQNQGNRTIRYYYGKAVL